MYEKIKEYKALLDEGLITEEEFEEQKAKILGFESPGEAAERRLAEEVEAERARLQKESEEKALLEKEKEEKRKREKRERQKAKAGIFIRNNRVKIIALASSICLLAVIAGIYAYIATPEKAFAVYSDSDKSLTFYKEKLVPKEGASFKGKACSSVYEGVEDLTLKWSWASDSDDNPGWSVDHSEDIESVSFAEEVTPISCRAWFTYLKNCSSFDLGNLNTSKVADFSYMFLGCSSVKELDLSGFSTGNALAFSRMFEGCSALTSIDLSSFDTESVYGFDWMFKKCSALTSLDVSSFDTRSATNMRGMFYMCEKLKSINLNKFNTDNVKDISEMFSNCSSLEGLDLSSFDVDNVEDFGETFAGCSKLGLIKGVESWDVSKGQAFEKMFYTCSSLSLDCSKWDVSGLNLKESNAIDRFNYNAAGVVPPSWPGIEGSEQESQAGRSDSSGTGISGHGRLRSSSATTASY